MHHCYDYHWVVATFIYMLAINKQQSHLATTSVNCCSLDVKQKDLLKELLPATLPSLGSAASV